MPGTIIERLAAGVVIFDGAMGTELYKRHFFVNQSFDALCLNAPDTIREIHRTYAEAGADVLTTNSFGANRNKLAAHGLEDQVGAINAAAVRLAREAGGDGVLVAGSVGPVGDIPFGQERDEEQAAAVLAEQIAALEEAGADFLLFETLTSKADVERALRGAARGIRRPFIVSLTVDRNGETAQGEPLDAVLQVIGAAERRPDILGLNCGEGPESTLSALEKMLPMVRGPVIVQPNAGVPKNVGGRMMYMTSPEYLTTYAVRYVNLGARGVGGCCGTTPEHIRDIARSIRPLAAAARSMPVEVHTRELALKPETPQAEKSGFGAKLAGGAWVTSVEIVPPRGWQLAETIAKARRCRAAGVDAINVPDGPRASARLSPLVTARAIQEEAGLEAILHFCCRDKSLIGMQADLLGCAALGLRNILFITGDPPKLGDFPCSSAVFDADSIGMVRIQHRMNCGVDLGAKPLDPPTRVLIGVGADPNAIDMPRELRRLREKAEAGAEFVITQPVFAIDPLLRFLEATGDLRLPVIAGLWPLASYRNAEFMKNEVPGVVVPDSVMLRMASAEGRDAQRREGIRIARECLAALRPVLRGVQVSAPFGNVETALAALAADESADGQDAPV